MYASKAAHDMTLQGGGEGRGGDMSGRVQGLG